MEVFRTIASLESSNTTDAELLWMVNTIPKHIAWKRVLWGKFDYYQFFAAVLTYVASTEQSKRSQVPLTAAVIHAMHTIESAVDKGSIDILPGTVLITSDSMSMTFYQVDALDDLWSDHCVELASALLQPHTRWSEIDVYCVSRFQLPLIAALYIDSTRQAGRAFTDFAKLLKLPNITGITTRTWEYVDLYDQMKLAGYWYVALFQEPRDHPGIGNYPFRDIGDVTMRTIEHRLVITLSALYLLDLSVEHLHATASSSINLDRRDESRTVTLRLLCTLPTGPIDYPITMRVPFNPWLLFHLDTLFPQSSLLTQVEFDQLNSPDTHCKS